MHHRRNGYVRNGRVSGRSGTGAGRVVPVEWIPAEIWWDDGEFWWDDGHTTKTDGVMGGTGERDTCGTCVGVGGAVRAERTRVEWCRRNGCRRDRWDDGNGAMGGYWLDGNQ